MFTIVTDVPEEIISGTFNKIVIYNLMVYWSVIFEIDDPTSHPRTTFTPNFVHKKNGLVNKIIMGERNRIVSYLVNFGRGYFKRLCWDYVIVE